MTDSAPNLTSVKERPLTRRSVANPEDTRPVTGRLSATPGLYVARESSPCDCGDVDDLVVGECGHKPDVWWSVLTECGFAVADYLLEEDLAAALAASLGDVGIDWAADEDDLLFLRRQAAAVLVQAAWSRARIDRLVRLP